MFTACYIVLMSCSLWAYFQLRHKQSTEGVTDLIISGMSKDMMGKIIKERRDHLFFIFLTMFMASCFYYILN
jgi:hypothetical protein